MTSNVSISDVLREGFEAAKKNLNSVVGVFIGLQALIFLITYFLNAPLFNILMVPVILLMQMAVFRSFKHPQTKFDINENIGLKESGLGEKLWRLFLTDLLFAVILILLLITIIGIPVAVFFFVYWFVAAYVTIDQGTYGWMALKKSKEIISGNGLKTLAIVGISLLISLISTALVSSLASSSSLVGGLLMSIVSSAISIYFGYVTVAYYLKLKK